MNLKDRVDQLDVALRIAGIQASKEALEVILELDKEIQRTKGKMTLTEVLDIQSLVHARHVEYELAEKEKKQ